MIGCKCFCSYYPDVMVACGPDPGDPYVESEPCLVVEVVSSSTEQTDRREKLAAYKRMPGLEAYLIDSQAGSGSSATSAPRTARGDGLTS
jgi:Uma2 family endonuclease